jgi:hypothetical protein
MVSAIIVLLLNPEELRICGIDRDRRSCMSGQDKVFKPFPLYNIKKCKILHGGTSSIKDVPAGPGTTRIFKLLTTSEFSGAVCNISRWPICYLPSVKAVGAT